MAQYLNRIDWLEKDPDGLDPDPYWLWNGEKQPLKKAIISMNPTDIISAKDLIKLELPPAEFIINNFIPVGLTVIGAPAKSFKSFMALQLSVSVATGTAFMGFETRKCGVLYFDLESTRRRPKNRLELILNCTEAPEELYIATKVEGINGQFEQQLQFILKENPGIRLVIVDVFKKIRPPKKGNTDPYERDYEDYGYMKRLADELNIGIVLIMHTTKMKHPDDPFNELIGSAGVMGSIDAAIVLKKEKREDTTAKIYVTGRDLEERCYEAEFNKKTFRWQMLGDATTVQKERRYQEYKESNVIKTLLKVLQQSNNSWSGTASELITMSMITNTPIHQDPAKVGRVLSEYKDLLEKYEGITFTNKHNGKTREYAFKIIEF